ncbi:MAG TPA: outer membrane lipoprotein-sorting protein [Candidatus Mcinerneyibacterium sp.]|nr:outer membrane lipoprotein-sorting protein [Candidatus Mcinerneyibacterium sp.]
MKKLIIIIIFLSLLTTIYSQKSDSNLARDIVKKVDQLYRSDSSYALMEMTIKTPHWNRTLKMETWSKGMDKTFIRIIEPQKEEGVATLRVKNQMWNYLPNTNKVIKIPPSMMMASWMGSDFTNDDLVSEYTFLEDYKFRLVKPREFNFVENKKDKGKYYYIKAIPKEDRPIVWGYIILAVKKDSYIPVWENYYDEKDKLVRVMRFKKVKNFDNKTIPSIMELIPKDKNGHKTVIEYLEADFNINISESIFTLRNLRKG